MRIIIPDNGDWEVEIIWEKTQIEIVGDIISTISIIIFIGVTNAIGIPISQVVAYYISKPKTV